MSVDSAILMEQAILKVILLMFKSSFLEKKIKSLAEIKEIVEEVD